MTVYTNFRWWETGEPQHMGVENGRVVFRGAFNPHSRREGEVDLRGRTLMPSFVDAHCHILPTGLDLQKLHLGGAQSHADVLQMVRERHRDQPDGWLRAVHYDQTKYEGGRHLTRHDLDKISTERPILLRHVNGHASIANTAALAAAGIDDSTLDPSGGTFGRDADGHLDGTLFEEAHEIVSRAAPNPDLETMVDAILLAGEKMAALGISCASDMMTGRDGLEDELNAYRIATERGCKIKMRLYVQWKSVFGPRAQPLPDDLVLGSDALRIAGIKIFADGAIGSATAAIYGKYSGDSPSATRAAGFGTGRRQGVSSQQYSGQLMYAPDKLIEMTRIASDAGYQVSIHSIGDYSTDLVMDAFEATGDPRRHRIEHAMILSDSQIERLASLGCFVTFQPEFLMRFGHSYRRQLGPERASRLKRTRSVMDAGIKLSFSSDRPIVAGDPWDGIRTAVNRDGFDPAERCTFQEAVRAYTFESARATGDEGRWGSLEPGMIADFQLRD